MKISTEEAIEVIKEWDVDCDNYVAHNYRQYMSGGNPCDNSQECADYFMECLKIVTDLGLQSQTQPVVEGGQAESVGCLICGCAMMGGHYEGCPKVKPPAV